MKAIKPRGEIKIKLVLDKKGMLHISGNEHFSHGAGVQILKKALEIVEGQVELMGAVNGKDS